MINIVVAYIPYRVCRRVYNTVVVLSAVVLLVLRSSVRNRFENHENWYENTETNGMYVCMYAVVVVAAATTAANGVVGTVVSIEIGSW